jgi:hypothetical protein
MSWLRSPVLVHALVKSTRYLNTSPSLIPLSIVRLVGSAGFQQTLRVLLLWRLLTLTMNCPTFPNAYFEAPGSVVVSVFDGIKRNTCWVQM